MKIKKNVEKICFYCNYYLSWWNVENGTPEDGPKCEYFNKHFPGHNKWRIDPMVKKPADRTCKNWQG
jgi:hypothetical protein